jgi:hypothetical protein
MRRQFGRKWLLHGCYMVAVWLVTLWVVLNIRAHYALREQGAKANQALVNRLLDKLQRDLRGDGDDEAT